MTKQIRDYVLEARLAKEQTNEADDYKSDFEEMKSGSRGSFMKALAAAFLAADTNNVRKLATAFPEVGKAHAMWFSGGKRDKI